MTLDKTSGHLACFDGGNFILGGLVLDEQKYIDFGLQLVEGCEDTYNQASVHASCSTTYKDQAANKHRRH